MEERRRTRRKLRRRQKGRGVLSAIGSTLGSVGKASLSAAKAVGKASLSAAKTVGRASVSAAKSGLSAAKSGVSSLKGSFSKRTGDSAAPSTSEAPPPAATSEVSSTPTTTPEAPPTPSTPTEPQQAAPTPEQKPAQVDNVQKILDTGKRFGIDLKKENVEEALKQVPEIQEELQKGNIGQADIEKLAQQGLNNIPNANQAFSGVDAMVDALAKRQPVAPQVAVGPTNASELDAATKAVEVISRVGTQQQKDDAVNALISKLRGGRRTRRSKKPKKKNRTRRH